MSAAEWIHFLIQTIKALEILNVNFLLQCQAHIHPIGSYHYYNHIILTVKSKRRREKSISISRDNVSSNPLNFVLIFLVRSSYLLYDNERTIFTTITQCCQFCSVQSSTTVLLMSATGHDGDQESICANQANTWSLYWMWPNSGFIIRMKKITKDSWTFPGKQKVRY